VITTSVNVVAADTLLVQPCELGAGYACSRVTPDRESPADSDHTVEERMIHPFYDLGFRHTVFHHLHQI
jgi:hypothetical protein